MTNVCRTRSLSPDDAFTCLIQHRVSYRSPDTTFFRTPPPNLRTVKFWYLECPSGGIPSATYGVSRLHCGNYACANVTRPRVRLVENYAD